MRLTIIPSDNLVCIDGESRSIDLSYMDPSIHAVQWRGSWGEVERKDPTTNHMTANEPISDVAQFQREIDAWSAAVAPTLSE